MYNWSGGSPVYLGNEQIAEIKPDPAFGYLIRNKRPNVTIGVCYSNTDLTEIRAFLDITYPGWRKDRRLFPRGAKKHA